MRMRKMAVAALAVTGVGLIPAPAKAQSTQDLIEMVGTMILADRLGIDPNMILLSQMNSGSSVFDLAPALAMGAFGNGDPSQILAMQSSGLGWDQIAGFSGVPQPTYNTLVRTRQLDPDYIWADELSGRYSVGQQRLEALHRAGYSWKEIAQGIVESQETGQPVEDALYENRMFGFANEPVYYNSYDPIYVPPRTTSRYVSVLPPPRDDWRYNAPLLDFQPDMWVDSSTSWRVQRPVVVDWSPVRVVRDPFFVRADDRDDWDDRHDNGLHLGWYKNGKKKKARFASRDIRMAPRSIWVRDDSWFDNRPGARVVFNEDSRWTSGRAQRFNDSRDDDWQRQRRLEQAQEARRQAQIRRAQALANERRDDAAREALLRRQLDRRNDNLIREKREEQRRRADVERRREDRLERAQQDRQRRAIEQRHERAAEKRRDSDRLRRVQLANAERRREALLRRKSSERAQQAQKARNDARMRENRVRRQQELRRQKSDDRAREVRRERQQSEARARRSSELRRQKSDDRAREARRERQQSEARQRRNNDDRRRGGDDNRPRHSSSQDRRRQEVRVHRASDNSGRNENRSGGDRKRGKSGGSNKGRG